VAAATGHLINREKETTMTKFTWEHVHLRSPNPEATAEWYHDKLGAEVIRTKNADGSTRIDLNLSVAGQDCARTIWPNGHCPSFLRDLSKLQLAEL